ncbi:hypothetical protein ABPG75_013282 [Micractinium tetrahymenae]
MSITSLQLHTAGPLVFSCRGCRTILGDSTDFVCSMQALDGARFVCLRGATEVRVDSIPTTSAGLHNSVHFSVCCVPCGAAVGRLYTQLPPALAPALNLLCLEDACCLSYELGTAEVRLAAGVGSSGMAAAAPASQQQQQQQQQQGQRDPRLLGSSGAVGLGGAATAGGALGTDPALVLELLQRVEQLEATLCTTQAMLVMHDEQLRELQGYRGDVAAAAAGT